MADPSVDLVELGRLLEAATPGPWSKLNSHERAMADAELLHAIKEYAPALLAEITRLREERERHPIETAPQDGRVIDVWGDDGRETVYWGLPPHECGEMGSYCDSDWHNIKAPGWVCSAFGEFVGPFTHWMPIPAGPSTLAGERT